MHEPYFVSRQLPTSERESYNCTRETVFYSIVKIKMNLHRMDEVQQYKHHLHVCYPLWIDQQFISVIVLYLYRIEQSMMTIGGTHSFTIDDHVEKKDWLFISRSHQWFPFERIANIFYLPEFLIVLQLLYTRTFSPNGKH